MKRRLIIIDGHALMHRAWHALPPLTAKDGMVVSGAYGFTMILLKAIKELKPSHVAVAFDLAGPTFRHKKYKEYKATREERPEELYAQFPIAEEILKAMEIPVYTAEGFEADDVIGTVAKQIGSNGQEEVIIVSGDKDLFQLVDKNIKMFYPVNQAMSEAVVIDEEAVIEKMGVRPDQVVDYKAICGDPSDNIPGVAGIGKVGATKLLGKYETLEGVYEHIEETKGAQRKHLEDSRENAFMSQDLAEIRLDVKTSFKLKDAEYRPVTREMVQDVFELYQFNRLLMQLPKADSEEGRKIGGQLGLLVDEQTAGAEVLEQDEVKIITDINEAKKLLDKYGQTKRLALRSVADNGGRMGSRIQLLALGDSEQISVFSGELIEGLLVSLRKMLSDSKRVLVCHDLKTELGVLENVGLSLSSQTFDLMIASYLLHAGERRHSLESILSFQRNVPPPPKKMDESASAARLASELQHFLSLADEYEEQLAEAKLDTIFREMEIPLVAVLSRLERNGIQLDAKYLQDFSGELTNQIAKLTKEIYKLAGEEFNINSPGQLKEILFDKLDISTAGIKKTAKGGTLSTAASELEKIRDEHLIVQTILDFRELSKLRSTYVDALPPLVDRVTGRIHADFNQTVTATGRLSSSNPNLQNIPTAGTEYGRKVRDAFVAEKGYVLLAADYSQIELRIAAHIAEEQTMIKAFKAGEDIHWRTAVEMFGEEKAKESRRIAKAINFGILYGMGAQRLAISADISFNEAHEYIETYFALHQGIADYIENTKHKVADQGYVETMFGRKRFFLNFHLLNPRERAEAERQAVNMPIQGTSADMIKQAMIALDESFCSEFGCGLEAPVRMILQVHDELVFEVKKDLLEEITPLVRNTMEGVTKLSVPIVVDIKTGQSWGSMEDL